jgi:hypothetical protein
MGFRRWVQNVQKYFFSEGAESVDTLHGAKLDAEKLESEPKTKRVAPATTKKVATKTAQTSSKPAVKPAAKTAATAKKTVAQPKTTSKKAPAKKPVAETAKVAK